MNLMGSLRFWKWGAAAVLLLTCLWLLEAGLLTGEEIDMPQHEAVQGEDLSALAARQEEFRAPGEPLRRETTLSAGDSVYSVLIRSGVSPSQYREILHKTSGVFDLSRVLPGHGLVLVFSPDSRDLTGMEYEISDASRLKVSIDGGMIRASREPVEQGLPPAGGLSGQTGQPFVRFERGEGMISSSLYESTVQAGLPPEIARGLTDIFAWDINFFGDIREGDTFQVLYERYYDRDAFKGCGRIVAARFLSRGQEHVALHFAGARGADGYFDEEGKPVRKLFLKAPFNCNRVSPGFFLNRPHPVLRSLAPHLGADYAAPSGTPVVAIGAGEVIFRGGSKGFGKSVQIRHPSGHVTCYGHLSGFAPGISRGSAVGQGEVIGYVGMTGYAAGPHLDFRVRFKGKYVNPLSLRAVQAPGLKGSELARFRLLKEKMLAMLDDTSLNYTMKLSTRY